MIEKIILYGLIAALVFLALNYLQKGTAEKVVAGEDGYYLLRLHKLYGILGIAGLILGLLISIMLIVTNESVFLAGIIIIVFWLPGFFCFIYYINHYLKFDNTVIETKNFWGQKKTVLWANIDNISFNRLSGLINISNKQGNKIRINPHLVGLSAFIKVMESTTIWTAEKINFPSTYK